MKHISTERIISVAIAVFIVVGMAAGCASAAAVEGPAPPEGRLEGLPEAQRPLFIGVIVLLGVLILVLALLFVLYSRHRNSERLAMEASMREQALVAENAMLDRLNRLKTEFFQNMSHDFKTPLTVISTSVLNATDMLDFELDEEEMRDCLKNAQREVMRMARMVDSAMKHSSMHDNRQDIEPVDISKLLREGADTYRAMLERHGNTLTLDLTCALPMVMGNTDMLLHVLSNLLSNANRFTRNGEVVIDAQSSVHNHLPVVMVSVSDNGEGVRPDILQKIFERGVSDGGTGLGLPICKTAVEAQGGAIGIGSELGKGTTVWFTIPLVDRRESLVKRDKGKERRVKNNRKQN